MNGHYEPTDEEAKWVEPGLDEDEDEDETTKEEDDKKKDESTKEEDDKKEDETTKEEDNEKKVKKTELGADKLAVSRLLALLICSLYFCRICCLA